MWIEGRLLSLIDNKKVNENESEHALTRSDNRDLDYSSLLISITGTYPESRHGDNSK